MDRLLAAECLGCVAEARIDQCSVGGLGRASGAVTAPGRLLTFPPRGVGILPPYLVVAQAALMLPDGAGRHSLVGEGGLSGPSSARWERTVSASGVPRSS